MPQSIESEVLAITKIKPSTKVNRERFLALVADAVEELDDDEWEKLSEDAQHWCNAATKAIKAEKPVPDFPSASSPKKKAKAKAAETEIEAVAEAEPEEEEQEEQAAAEEEDSAGEMRSSTKMKKVAKKKVAARAKANGSNGASKPRKLTSGVPTIIKQMILKNPQMTKDDIVTALKKKGLKVSDLTVSTQRNEFRHALRVIQDAGLLKRDLHI